MHYYDFLMLSICNCVFILVASVTELNLKMLYIVLLLLAIAKPCLSQVQPQGADMPLNIPPQLDNIGPGVGIKRHPGQPPALFVDAPIDTGGGQTQFATGGELPQFGMDGGGGVPPIDSARNMLSPIGGVSQTDGQVIGTGGIVSAGHMIDPGAGVVSHIDQGGQLGIDAAGAFMGGPVMPDIGVPPGTGAQPMMVDTGALLTGQAGVLDVQQGHGQGGFGGHVAKSGTLILKVSLCHISKDHPLFPNVSKVPTHKYIFISCYKTFASYGRQRWPNWLSESDDKNVSIRWFEVSTIEFVTMSELRTFAFLFRTSLHVHVCIIIYPFAFRVYATD